MDLLKKKKLEKTAKVREEVHENQNLKQKQNDKLPNKKETKATKEIKRNL